MSYKFESNTMKNIILGILMISPVLFSCTKEAEYNIAKEPLYNPVKYGYRVCEINGENSHWGKYTLKIHYTNEITDSIARLNSDGKVRGMMKIKMNSKTNRTYTFNDFIYNIDADSIIRLNEKLEAKYGKGNYSLEDSIPLAGKTIRKYDIIMNEYGKDLKQTITYNSPFTDPGAGDNFDNNYIQDSILISRFEFNEQGQLIAERIFLDTYKEDKKLEARRLLKREYKYQGERLVNIIYSEARSGENFKETGRDNYTYRDGRISSIKGYSNHKTIVYNGQQMNITENGKITEYKIDERGFMTYVKYPDGSFMNIKYEQGNGDFEHLISMYERNQGLPFIK